MTAAFDVPLSPYLVFLGIGFELSADQITGRLDYRPELIGNPLIPALHGGVTAAFLETTAQVTLLNQLRKGQAPRVIDMSIDYLRPGLAQNAYALAQIIRSGRRYASVDVRAWQQTPEKPFATARVHFGMTSHGE